MTNRVVKIIGRVESSERFLRIALYQGAPQRSKKVLTGTDAKLVQPDPMLLCCAYKRQRLYLFTQQEPQEVEDAASSRWALERPCVGVGLVGGVCVRGRGRGGAPGPAIADCSPPVGGWVCMGVFFPLFFFFFWGGKDWRQSM